MQFVLEYGTHVTEKIVYGGKETLQGLLSNLQLRGLRDAMQGQSSEDVADFIFRPYIHTKVTAHSTAHCIAVCAVCTAVCVVCCPVWPRLPPAAL